MHAVCDWDAVLGGPPMRQTRTGEDLATHVDVNPPSRAELLSAVSAEGGTLSDSFALSTDRGDRPVVRVSRRATGLTAKAGACSVSNR